MKNKENVIEKTIQEKYVPLKTQELDKIKKSKEAIVKAIEQLKLKTKNSNSHPYLIQTKIDEFIEYFNSVSEKIVKFEKDIVKQLDTKEKEIKKLHRNDTILSRFESLITVGEDFHFNEIMKIIEEGKLRYEFKIPPGYMDIKDKDGTQIFGDLILWKQILKYAKEKESNVIFICNDIKEDWCYQDKKNRITHPREELIKEFRDIVKKEFWMYNQSQFLYTARKVLNVKFEDSKIEEVTRVINNRNTLEFSSSEINSLNEAIKYTIAREGNFSSNDPFVQVKGKINSEEGLNIKNYNSIELSVLLKAIDENIKYLNHYNYGGLPDEMAINNKQKILIPLYELRTKIMKEI